MTIGYLSPTNLFTDRKGWSGTYFSTRQAIDNSAVNLLSSQWTASSVINDYHASKDRVFVLPFGANIDDSKIVQAQVYQSGRLNVLFTGVDWERKGGQIAVDTVKKLRYNGADVHLYICGIRDLAHEVTELDFVENLGFLNKNKPEEYQKYLDVWSNSHLLLLPTRAECSAIVFNEASAYGVPILSTDTGGIVIMFLTI